MTSKRLHCEAYDYFFVGLLFMATNKPQDNYIRTALRLPKDLHSQIHEAAQADKRSFNSEIIARLTDSFKLGNIVAEKITKEELLDILEKNMQVSVQPGAKFMLSWASVAVENKKFIDENLDLFDQVVEDNPDIAFLPAIEEVKRLLRKKENKK